VFPNTPASRAGVKRGDLFTKINGTTLTVSNYVDLLFGANSSTLNIGFVNYVNKEYVDVKTTQIITAEIIENPIMLDSVYTINGKKIGYFAYKNFIPDPGDSSLVYDNKMNAIFGKFKSEGINELVLDLRLNTGGSVSSAIKLASLIVHGATQNDILLHSKYNTLLTNELRSYKGESAFYEKFNSAANNVGSTISRLVVLTGKHTASASELIINGLRPYMQVITVGDTTYGKNVGSITITDDSKKITWGLQPIIVKLFNKNNESDYTHGFVPTIYDADNKLVLYQFGDLREPLLREAITQVYGIPLDNVAPLKAKQKSSLGREVGNSLAHHPGAYSTIMNR
jgi:C-terminal processing protease CtpA/Prc